MQFRVRIMDFRSNGQWLTLEKELIVSFITFCALAIRHCVGIPHVPFFHDLCKIALITVRMLSICTWQKKPLRLQGPRVCSLKIITFNPVCVCIVSFLWIIYPTCRRQTGKKSQKSYQKSLSLCNVVCVFKELRATRWKILVWSWLWPITLSLSLFFVRRLHLGSRVLFVVGHSAL